jgi:Predicted endonuclease containing a URI domain
VRLVWCEYADRVEDAFRREKQIQGWSRAKKRLLIADRADELTGWGKERTP